MKVTNPPYPSSVYIITPISRKARAWVKRNVALEPWQWQGAGFVLDFHSAPIIVRAMLDQGMEDGKDFEVASGNPVAFGHMGPFIKPNPPKTPGLAGVGKLPEPAAVGLNSTEPEPAAVVNPSRKEAAKKTWRARRSEGGKGRCAFCHNHVFAGGETHNGRLYHKTCWEFKEAGLSPAQVGLNPRPPARWWAYMWPRIAAGYPRRRGESLKHCREAINQIVGGIWWGYPEKTRARLIRKFENPIGRVYPSPYFFRLNPAEPESDALNPEAPIPRRWLIPGAAGMNPRKNPFLDDLATGLALGGGWSIAALGVGHVAKALKRKKGEKKKKA